RQRGMADQVHFPGGREQADLEPVAAADKERRFRKVEFPGNCQKQPVVRPAGQQTDGGRIACESPLGEGINEIERNGLVWIGYHGQAGLTVTGTRSPATSISQRALAMAPSLSTCGA